MLYCHLNSIEISNLIWKILYKAQKEEVSRKLAQVRKAIADYRAKYGDDAPLPAELLEQLAQLEQLEAQLEKEIAEKTEKLAQVNQWYSILSN